MALDTLQPTPTWDPEAHPDVVETFAALADDDAVMVHVWGADWCGDCRRELPDLAAALDAAGFPESRRHVHPLDREKDGELVAEYGVERIPTVVVERDGAELARFVESAAVPAPVALADAL